MVSWVMSMTCFIFSIYNLQPEDSGRYICIVSNDAGTTRDFANLFVRGRAIGGGGGGAVGIREQIQTVAEGDTVEINCDVSGKLLSLS